MNVEEVRRERAVLENTLHALFVDFRRRTGVAVEGITVDAVQVFELTEKGSRSVVQGVRVFLESL